MKNLIYNYLLKEGLLQTNESDLALNCIKKTTDEVILSGNKLGLIILADYIVSVALENKSYHIHLDELNFFDNSNTQLIIELIDE